MAVQKPIILKNLSLIFPNKICFEGFDALVPCGGKIAVMGDNGTGKTTLLKAIMGLPTPLEGDINLPRGTRTAYVPQVIELYGKLSGGERFNKALTSAMAQNPDILLLDEPTNHLDISNRKSLINMLEHYESTLIVTSHDPEVLRLIKTIWHIKDGRIEVFNGSYDDYKAEFALKRQSLQARLNTLEKERKQAHKNLMREQKRAANSRRQGELSKQKGKWAPIIAGGKKRQAQKTAGRQSSLIRDRKSDINEEIRRLSFAEIITPSFNLPAGGGTGAVLFIMDGAAGYGKNTVLRDINLSLQTGEKIAVTGDNASGKSTLFKAILDAALRLGGVWETPVPADIGYLDQHYGNIENAPNALDLISNLMPSWSREQIRKHLNSFLFRKNEEVLTPVKYLSGGERARLSLAAIACKVPKLLLLDEITNNIDLQTREHIEQILSAYPGAIAIISHDMEFLKTVGVKTFYQMSEGNMIKITQP